MSSSGSAQLSPRILAAYERLEDAVSRLKQAADSQGEKVDISEVHKLKNQVTGLEQDNLALSEALEAYAEADTDAQFEKLNDQIDALRDENGELQNKTQLLKNMNSDFSARIEKLIGNVQQVLEEE